MPKVATDSAGRLGEPTHVADDGALEGGLAAGGWSPRHGVLQVSVQPLVRVQLRAIGGQGEDLDLLLVPDQPVLHRLGPMDRQVVPDQEQLAAGLLDQPPEKADQARGLERVLSR